MRLFLLLITFAAGAFVPPALGEEPEFDFAHEVLPILRAHCAACHAHGKAEGEVSFDSRAKLMASGSVKPGASGGSELIARVTSSDPDLRMPPKGKPLSAEEIAALRRWIDLGAPWPEEIRFDSGTYARLLPLERPPVPAGREEEHALDRLLSDYWKEQGIAPPNVVDDLRFARRAYLDVIGLLPTPEELNAFTADPDPSKRVKLVRALLSRDRDYAEHWLSFWNDLLRNDYQGTGYIDGGRKPISNWLYAALRENKPYDRFVRELVSPSAESEGFIRGIKWRGNVNASQTEEVQFAQNTAQVMLGINLKCASCHDSFIDEWKLTDAYAFSAVVSARPLEIHRCDQPVGETARAAFLFPQLGTIDPDQPPAERLRRLAEILTSRENGLLPRTVVNRLWQRLLGRGIVHPVDVMKNPAWSSAVLDELAWQLVEQGYDLKQVLELILTSRAYQAEIDRVEEEPGEDYRFRGPLPRRLTAEQFVDSVWRLTGTAPGQPAFPCGDRGGAPVRASLVPADFLQLSLGRPNREQVVSTRPEQLTTLQALDLANGPILADLLTRGGVKLHKELSGRPAEEMVRALYERMLGRPPSAEESRQLASLLGDEPSPQTLADLLWLVLMLPEFQLIQ